MEFLLTADELKALQERPSVDALWRATESARILRRGVLTAAKAQCNRDRSETPEGFYRLTYCDECPVGKLLTQYSPRMKEICPDADHWSK